MEVISVTEEVLCRNIAAKSVSLLFPDGITPVNHVGFAIQQRRIIARTNTDIDRSAAHCHIRGNLGSDLDGTIGLCLLDHVSARQVGFERCRATHA